MNSVYAMRRANGDWYAVEHQGRLRLPVYRDTIGAWRGHWRNAEMALFKPVALDEGALTELAQQGAACFWLVEDPLAYANKGVELTYAQLAQLVRGGTPAEPSVDRPLEVPGVRAFPKMTPLVAARK